MKLEYKACELDEYLQYWKVSWTLYNITLILKKKQHLDSHDPIINYMYLKNSTVGVSLIKVKKYEIHWLVKICTKFKGFVTNLF